MKYVVGNWKMQMTSQEMLLWFDNWYELKKDFSGTDIEVILAPAHIHIPLIASLIRDSIKLAAQDVSAYEKGAHTGENGAFQVKEFCEFSIVGHSERNEDTGNIKTKRDNCLKAEITPIICFTEPQQVKDVYKDSVLLAWEDPDNISKNGEYREKSPEEIVKGVKKIREQIPNESILLYGGSVNRQNIKDLVNIEQLDGVLMGNASLDPRHFLDIIHTYQFKTHK